MHFILLQHLFYFIAHETASLHNGNTTEITLILFQATFSKEIYTAYMCNVNMTVQIYDIIPLTQRSIK